MQGITALSPVLSWARQADRLAFVYFEQGRYDVYSLTTPRTLKKQPWTQQTIAQRPLAIIAPSGEAARPAVARITPPSGPQILSGATVYEYIASIQQATGSLAPFAWLPLACKLLFGIVVVFAGWGLVRRLSANVAEVDLSLLLSWGAM